jgi:hypothetical protein
LIWLKVASSKSNPNASLGQSLGVSNQMNVGEVSIKVLINQAEARRSIQGLLRVAQVLF